MSQQNNVIKVLDKNFKHYITHEEIQESVLKIANEINREYKNRKLVFIIVLNGAFMFGSDLLKNINIDCEISFLRVSSYEGMSSTEKIKDIFTITEDLSGREIIVVEDIIDTGLTMEHILSTLKNHEVASVKICTLLFKKDAFKRDYPIDYIGFSIPNEFVVGYGLDYDGYGRNLKDIYSVTNENETI